MVTPCMGVWIETETRKAWEPPTLVTPCMGVWIETQQMDINAQKGVSHPVWVCGLKQPAKC